MTDQLTRAFESQTDFQRRLGYDPTTMTTEQRAAYIRDMVLAATNELQAEILPEIKWKPWSNAKAFVHDTAILGECADVLCFLLNIVWMVLPGATPAEAAEILAQTHMAKVQVNNKRQDDGYDGTNKCPRCRRALDDPTVRCYLPKDQLSAGWCDARNVFYHPRGHQTKSAS